MFTVEALGQGQGLDQKQRLDQGLIIEDETRQEQQHNNVEARGLLGESSLLYALQPSGRIAHSQMYIERIIQEVGR